MPAPRLAIARRLLAAAILVTAVAGPSAQGAPPASRALLVVLDASGSMREAVEGGIKSDLAVRGLLRTLAALPAGTLVGLRLMGEGPPGGAPGGECGATREAVAAAPFDAARWRAALAAVRWSGATPLVSSMRAALDELRRVPATHRELLIIGDGEETCGEDPVGVARAEADGIRIHTISLGEDVSHQLAGIALVTRGTYARVYDESTFDEAADRAMPAAPAAPAGPAAGARPGRVEIVLDLSNSMWGQVNGRPKIELAREGLAAALDGFPADLPIGLRAYGHRVSVADRDAGCADTERLLAPAAGNGPEITRLAAALRPGGQTPIARSLQEAGADLRREGGSGVIVLVSDGVESCGGDPAAVARELRASGLAVVLHTVGLGVGDDEAEALEALAVAGGGSYFDAPTPEELVFGMGAALARAGELVLQEDAVAAFPADIERVSGGATPEATEVVEPGVYSFTDHLFREQRYFAVRGTPGAFVTVRGMVSALEIGRTRADVVTYQGSPGMMFIDRVDAAGRRLRGRSLVVRGDMGTRESFTVTVGDDGLARFRVGRPQGNVHRDMIFAVER
ncbi:MAG: VWA domain-containing protein [Vicinamibacterales bacterium]